MKIHLIDYLTEEDRKDTIIKKGIQDLLSIKGVEHEKCDSPSDIGKAFDCFSSKMITGESVSIHFLAHGNEYGIARRDHKYYVELIHWELLLKSIEKLAIINPKLYVNLLAVCRSGNIEKYNLKPYSKLWASRGETPSIAQSCLIYKEPHYLNLQKLNRFMESSNFIEINGTYG